jgi:hypothetical protein
MSILQDALTIISKDRATEYGTPEDSFAVIADFWSVYLGREVNAQDVAIMMALLKIARLYYNKNHKDSWIDLAGYAACGGGMIIEPIGQTA